MSDEPYVFTKKGLVIRLPVVPAPYQPSSIYYFAILACHDSQGPLALLLKKISSRGTGDKVRDGEVFKIVARPRDLRIYAMEPIASAPFESGPIETERITCASPEQLRTAEEHEIVIRSNFKDGHHPWYLPTGSSCWFSISATNAETEPSLSISDVKFPSRSGRNFSKGRSIDDYWLGEHDVLLLKHQFSPNIKMNLREEQLEIDVTMKWVFGRLAIRAAGWEARMRSGEHSTSAFMEDDSSRCNWGDEAISQAHQIQTRIFLEGSKQVVMRMRKALINRRSFVLVEVSVDRIVEDRRSPVGP